jgi:alpha-L-fucosidase 2
MNLGIPYLTLYNFHQQRWTRPFFMLTVCLLMATAGAAQVSGLSIDPFKRAKQHHLRYAKPAPDFFEGALLGNGGMGAVVTTRPDAIVIRFGHNNVWDIRIAERNREKLGTFQAVFAQVDKIDGKLANLTDDPWYAAYNSMASENYAKPYPRPFPCGSVLLGFDPRKVSLVGHDLDIADGKCRVELLTATKETLFLELFVSMEKDQLWMQLVDRAGKPRANLFDRLKVMPDPSTPASFPSYQTAVDLSMGTVQFRQILPRKEEDWANAQRDLGNKAFTLAVRTNQPMQKQARISWNGNAEPMGALEVGLTGQQPFLACVSLAEGLEKSVRQLAEPLEAPSLVSLKRTDARNLAIWKAYWNKSAVSFADTFLEAIWYRNLYFFNCATKPGITCPGLFANWSYDNIGTAWHGDYHMNYNTQQPFWLTFSSNHLEKNAVYVDLVESLMPVSRKWAKEYYGLPGAYFPHSAYPVEMTMNPYPIPDWGWEVSETPWTVQGLWWHYLYSKDTAFLKERAYEPIKAAVEFLTAYMTRPEASGSPRWKDDKFHIFPTVPPELYGLRPGFKYNYDCAADLSLTKFIFKAFKEATSILHTQQSERKLLAQVDRILAAFPAYPTAMSSMGEVYVAVPGEHASVVHNVPNPLFAVFPGEDLGLDSDHETLQILENTYRNQQNEGGNDLVFINLQAARIGKLDLERFKRQVNYALLPNGTATDKVMQTGGRYSDATAFDYMAKMGIWFENFALPAVINECLVQGHNGKLRIFPNWPKDKDAAFDDLRTAGAFLVGAVQRNGKIEKVTVRSEQGSDLHIVLPWKKTIMVQGEKRIFISTATCQMKTKAGQKMTFYPG